MPLEKEQQVRLQARKQLEEQLRQYRAKRQQERVSLPLSDELVENLTCEKQQFVRHNSRICCLFLSLGGWASVLLCKDHFCHVVPTLWFPPRLVLLASKAAFRKAGATNTWAELLSVLERPVLGLACLLYKWHSFY